MNVYYVRLDPINLMKKQVIVRFVRMVLIVIRKDLINVNFVLRALNVQVLVCHNLINVKMVKSLMVKEVFYVYQHRKMGKMKMQLLLLKKKLRKVLLLMDMLLKMKLKDLQIKKQQ